MPFQLYVDFDDPAEGAALLAWLAERRTKATTSAINAEQKPACPTHGMEKVKPSRQGGGWYCSARVGSGYCTWTIAA
jgi:hypothetical protein